MEFFYLPMEKKTPTGEKIEEIFCRHLTKRWCAWWCSGPDFKISMKKKVKWKSSKYEPRIIRGRPRGGGSSIRTCVTGKCRAEREVVTMKWVHGVHQFSYSKFCGRCEVAWYKWSIVASLATSLDFILSQAGRWCIPHRVCCRPHGAMSFTIGSKLLY